MSILQYLSVQDTSIRYNLLNYPLLFSHSLYSYDLEETEP